MPTLITVHGIGETAGRDLLGRLRDLLPNWEHIIIPWQASYGFVNSNRDPLGPSFNHSLQDGIRKTRAALDRGPAFIAGYSGGAAVVGHVAAQGHRNLLGVGLVSDPFAPGTAHVHGVAGRRFINNKHLPAKWVSNPHDIICCCPHDSPVKTIADTSLAMSLGDRRAWGRDIIDRLKTDRIAALFRNPFRLFNNINRFDAAIRGVAGYLGAEHTCYGVRNVRPGVTYLADLAEWLRRQA